MGIWPFRLRRGAAPAEDESRPTLVDRRIERLDERLERLRQDHARIEGEVTAAVEGERRAAARSAKAAAPPPFVVDEAEDAELDTAGRERRRREQLLRAEWDGPQPEDEGGRWAVLPASGQMPLPTLEHERRRVRTRALVAALLAISALALLLWIWRDLWWPVAGGVE